LIVLDQTACWTSLNPVHISRGNDQQPYATTKNISVLKKWQLVADPGADTAVPMSSKFSHPFRPFKRNLYTYLISPICATCPAYVIILDLIILIIFGEEYTQTPHYAIVSSLLSLHHSNIKIFSSALVLKHPQSVLFGQCER
jgi:hypothetical protein